MPWLYEVAEQWLLRRCAHVFSVRQSAVIGTHDLPSARGAILFHPDMGRNQTFFILRVRAKNAVALRSALSESLNLPVCKIIISVGRLDRQKDPLFLLDSMGVALKTRSDPFLILVGDGTLRDQVETKMRSPELLVGVFVLLSDRCPRSAPLRISGFVRVLVGVRNADDVCSRR